MKKGFKITLIILILIAIGAFFTQYIYNHNIPVLEPEGMVGEKERDLIYTATLLMLIVVIPVFIFTLFFAWRYKESNTKAKHEPDWEHNYIAEYCWWGVPLFIIVILAVITWKSSHELNPFTPLKSNQKPLAIQVIALDWKWLFIYPEEKIAVINFVQFPVNTPLNFEITSDAPMNSFWIPELGGQIYAMPAMRSKLHLIADQIGSYRGVSANISGTGFAGMRFTAKSSTEEEFNAWVQSVKQSAKLLTLSEYETLMQPSEYNPVVYYVLSEEDLFEKVLMKYMAHP